LRGKPLFNEGQLQLLLREFFGDTEIAKLSPETFIIAADLRSGKSHEYSKKNGFGGEKVVDCLMDSCGLPYFFRAPQNLGVRAYVDGGICENLPSDVLQAVGEETQRERMLEEFGPVVGISFEDTKRPEPRNNFLEFSMALIDTAISNSVNRAKKNIGPDTVFCLETDISTFDFQKALSIGLEDKHYDGVKRALRPRFQTLIRALESGRRNRLITVSNPWLEKSRKISDIMLQVGTVYENSFLKTQYEVREASLVVTAYSLLSEDDDRHPRPDEQRWTILFNPGQDPVHCIATSVDTRGKYTRWRVSDKNSSPVAVTVVPMLRKAFHEDTGTEKAQADGEDWALLFFGEVLRQSDRGPYRIIETSEVPDMMAPLKTGIDHLWVRISGINTFEKVNLVLRLPEAFAQKHQLRLVKGEVTKGLTPVDGRPMNATEQRPYEDDSLPFGFCVQGWTGGPVRSGECIAVDFLCTPSLPAGNGGVATI